MDLLESPYNNLNAVTWRKLAVVRFGWKSEDTRTEGSVQTPAVNKRHLKKRSTNVCMYIRRMNKIQ